MAIYKFDLEVLCNLFSLIFLHFLSSHKLLLSTHNFLSFLKHIEVLFGVSFPRFGGMQGLLYKMCMYLCLCFHPVEESLSLGMDIQMDFWMNIDIPGKNKQVKVKPD